MKLNPQNWDKHTVPKCNKFQQRMDVTLNFYRQLISGIYRFGCGIRFTVLFNNLSDTIVCKIVVRHNIHFSTVNSFIGHERRESGYKWSHVSYLPFSIEPFLMPMVSHILEPNSQPSTCLTSSNWSLWLPVV